MDGNPQAWDNVWGLTPDEAEARVPLTTARTDVMLRRVHYIADSILAAIWALSVFVPSLSALYRATAACVMNSWNLSLIFRFVGWMTRAMPHHFGPSPEPCFGTLLSWFVASLSRRMPLHSGWLRNMPRRQYYLSAMRLR